MASSTAINHTKRALLELRQRIINGKIAGGQRLYEVALAEELQVSRTPAREAMSRLTEEGLLERSSGGGFMVRSFSRQDVFHAIEIRGVLEGTAARIAAEQGVSEEDLVAIKKTLRELDECFGERVADVNFDLYSELNRRFHTQLGELSGSDLIVRELERAKSLPFASPSAFVPNNSEFKNFQISLVVAQQQHHSIVAAIQAREGTRAEMLGREHARIARSNIEYAFGLDADQFSNMSPLALVVEKPFE